jgi:hypothetical protein
VPYLPILMYLYRLSAMMRSLNLWFGCLLLEVGGGGGRELLFGRYPLDISFVLFSFSLMSISSYHGGRRDDWKGIEAR